MDRDLDTPREIGRYLIDRPLARGGMAEVFVARAQGPAGFSKKVVIKRILPEYAGDERFVSMFLNEARLAALIDHPNVVQVFDFGEHEGSYFIAMEYIEGASLRDILRYYTSRQQSFPVPVALKWMCGVCEGLHHAHNLRDEGGKLYDIVHRDISPDNILIAKSGMPKLVDFGIAKAAAQTTETVAGGVKGKFAYMSPEQIRGEPADRQLDVYALGVTLFEILAGTRPFTAESPLQLMHKVVHETPPDVRSLRPALDEPLALIVARALAPKSQRYPDVAALQADLEEELARKGTRVASGELIAVLEQVTSARRVSKKVRDPESPSRPLGAGCESPSSFAPVTIDADSHPTQAPSADARPAVAARERPKRANARTGMGRLAVAALLAGAVALFGVAGFYFAGLQEASRSSSEVTVIAVEAEPTATGEAAPDSPPAAPKAVPEAAPAVVRAAEPTASAVPAPAKATVSPGSSALPARPRPAAAKVPARRNDPASASAPTRNAAPKQDGRLTLRTDPWCEVYLDGEPLGTTPLVRIAVPPGPHTLLLVNAEAGIRRKVPIAIKAGEELKKSLLLEQER